MRQPLGFVVGGSIAVLAATAFAMPVRQVTAPAITASSASSAPLDGNGEPGDAPTTGASKSSTTSTSPTPSSSSTPAPSPGATRPPSAEPTNRVERADQRAIRFEWAGDAVPDRRRRPPRPTATATTGAGGNDRTAASSWLDAPAPSPELCPKVLRSVVIDRRWQRAWICVEGGVASVIPVTTARDQPDPGDYPVYARDWQSFSDAKPRRSWLDRFIAFARGENEGLRVGFHAVPYYENGRRLQPIDSVGSLGRFGASGGCIRLRPQHAEFLWGFLQEGDTVRVLN